jgi:hypothetical protein
MSKAAHRIYHIDRVFQVITAALVNEPKFGLVML